jgi:hypothetical protein
MWLFNQTPDAEPSVLQNNFLHSLLAVYEAAEIVEQLCRVGLPLCVEVVSEHHVIAWSDVG